MNIVNVSRQTNYMLELSFKFEEVYLKWHVLVADSYLEQTNSFMSM